LGFSFSKRKGRISILYLTELSKRRYEKLIAQKADLCKLFDMNILVSTEKHEDQNG
jgi:hypothetical protein